MSTDIENTKEEETPACTTDDWIVPPADAMFSTDGFCVSEKDSCWMWFNYKVKTCINGLFSVYGMNCMFSAGSVNAMFCILAVNSCLSLLSCNSVFSVLSLVSRLRGVTVAIGRDASTLAIKKDH